MRGATPIGFSNNQQVQAKQKFTYDALYRLKVAEGREHTGLNNPDYYKDTNAYKQSAFISITDPNDDNRLANYTRNYTYDKAGNMLTVQHVAADSPRSFTRTIRVEEDSNRWLPANMGNNLTIGDYYDSNGNIQELETLLQVNWNYRDNISSGVIVDRTGVDDAEYYVYDSTGQRVRKVKETLTSLVNNTVEIEEKIYTGNVETKKIRVVQGGTSTTILNRSSLHVMDDTRRIATVHNWTTDTLEREINAQGELNTNKIRYQYGNHIDSASLELDSSGSIISYEEYFPYGDTSLIAGTSQKEVKIKEYRYTGKEKDDATGLYYYGARYYASWLGRWMSADPLFRENPAVYDRPKGGSAEEQEKLNTEYMQKLYHEGLNMYCYVKGNPVTFSDPSGLQSKEVQNSIYKALYFWSKDSQAKYSANSQTTQEKFISPIKGVSKEEIIKNTDKTPQTVGKARINFEKGNRFGPRPSGFHKGTDISGVAGETYVAMKSGRITYGGDEKNLWGYHAIIKHADGSESIYAHMTKKSFEKFSKLYSGENNQIKQGNSLGIVGNTGRYWDENSESYKGYPPHAHVGIRVPLMIDTKKSFFKLNSEYKVKQHTDEKGAIFNYYNVENIWRNNH